MTLDEFEAMPHIMSYFPLIFTTGRQKWTNFIVSCNQCKTAIPDERTRGCVYPTTSDEGYRQGYRQSQMNCYYVAAHALCPVCNKLTTTTYLLHENMTFIGIHHDTGKVERWGMRKLTRWEKFVEWIKGS